MYKYARSTITSEPVTARVQFSKCSDMGRKPPKYGGKHPDACENSSFGWLEALLFELIFANIYF